MPFNPGGSGSCISAISLYPEACTGWPYTASVCFQR